MRGLLASPLRFLLSRRLLVVVVTGRRSGTVYRLPVGYVEHDGVLLVGTGGRGHRNLVARQKIPIVLEGKKGGGHAPGGDTSSMPAFCSSAPAGGGTGILLPVKRFRSC